MSNSRFLDPPRSPIAAESNQGNLGTTTGSTNPPANSRKRPRWRLRILLAINAFVAVLFAISQLEPATVKKLGPAGEFVFGLLQPSDDPEGVSPACQRLKADVRAMGGQAQFMGRSYRFLGLFGPIESLLHLASTTQFR